MTMIDRLPDMALADLKRLRINAERLSQTPGKQQTAATEMLTAVDAELAGRDEVKQSAAARKAERVAKPRAPKAAAEPKAPREPKPKKPQTASEKADVLVADIEDALKRG